jgi:glutamate racemase
MPHPDNSIGIFDSGFGGLTIMKAIRESLPSENMIYFGDTARIPYGTKSQETILRYAIQNASFLIDQNIKVLVVACHTACCLSLEKLQKHFSIPIIGVTHPSVEHIARLPSATKIAVLGTNSTIASGLYQTLLQQRCPQAEITGIACQLFVNLVEEGFIDHPLTTLAIQEYLKPLTSVDTILLGCTHFPLLATQIQNHFPHPVTLIDPAIGCAQALTDLLTTLDLLRSPSTPPTYQFYVSDAPEKFQTLGKKFFPCPLPQVQKMDLFHNHTL